MDKMISSQIVHVMPSTMLLPLLGKLNKMRGLFVTLGVRLGEIVGTF